jgi:hypothetical protein
MRRISATMVAVRLFLTLAIALHLSGVPAVMAWPCAMGGEGSHHCCMTHQTESGGPTIGHCACPVPGQASDSVSAVSTTAASPEKAGAPILVAAGHVSLVPASLNRLPDVRPIGFGPGPPPLTAVGLRC